MHSRYPFGRSSGAPAAVRLLRRFEYNELQELHDKIQFLMSVRHSNLVGVLRTVEKREELSFEVYYEYVPRSLREAGPTLSEEQLEHGRSSLYHVCSHLLSNNVNPEIAEELIGVDEAGQLRLFLDVDFRVLAHQQSRTDLIRAKRVEINAILDHYIAAGSCAGRCRGSRNPAGVLPAEPAGSYLRTAEPGSGYRRFESAVPAMPYDPSRARVSAPKPEPVGRHSSSVGPREAREVPRSISGVLNAYLPLPRMSAADSQSSSGSKKPKRSQFAKYSNRPRHQPSIQLGLPGARCGEPDPGQLQAECELPLDSEVEVCADQPSPARPSRARYEERLTESEDSAQ